MNPGTKRTRRPSSISHHNLGVGMRVRVRCCGSCPCSSVYPRTINLLLMCRTIGLRKSSVTFSKQTWLESLKVQGSIRRRVQLHKWFVCSKPWDDPCFVKKWRQCSTTKFLPLGNSKICSHIWFLWVVSKNALSPRLASCLVWQSGRLRP